MFNTLDRPRIKIATEGPRPLEHYLGWGSLTQDAKGDFPHWFADDIASIITVRGVDEVQRLLSLAMVHGLPGWTIMVYH